MQCLLKELISFTRPAGTVRESWNTCLGMQGWCQRQKASSWVFHFLLIKYIPVVKGAQQRQAQEVLGANTSKALSWGRGLRLCFAFSFVVGGRGWE